MRYGIVDATACTVSGMFCSFPAGETPEQSCGNNETFGDCVFAPTTCFIIFATDRLGIARPGRQVCGCDGQTYKGGSGAAYIARDGQIYKVTWLREKKDGVFSLLNADGTLFPYKPGQTWYEVLGASSKVDSTIPQTWRFTHMMVP